MTASTTTTTIRMRDRVPAQALIEHVLEHPDADAAWYRAAQGQRLVAGLLAQMPAGWAVFHSMPVAGEDRTIDHVLVGPAGVLPVTAAYHPGARMIVAGRVVTVAGQRLPTVRGAEADGDRLGRLLVAHGLGAVPVAPVVAVAAPTRLVVKERPRGVAVVPAETLRSRLLEKPRVLDAETTAAVVALLDRPDVWRPTEEAKPDLLQRFTELESRRRPGPLAALIGRFR
ncbi:MAG: nuclease-related domain-containing protein [Amnibacterium sp.]